MRRTCTSYSVTVARGIININTALLKVYHTRSALFTSNNLKDQDRHGLILAEVGFSDNPFVFPIITCLLNKQK